jgi:ADP-ribose pyrophosphatase
MSSADRPAGRSRDLIEPPWQTTGSRLIYAHPGLLLTEDRILRPTGDVDVLHRLTEPASVRVIAVDSDGQLALVWRWRYAIGYPVMELPSALLAPAEQPISAARRALRDACGLTAEEWTPLGAVTVATEVAAQTVHLFRADRTRRTLRLAGDTGEQTPFTLPYDVAVSIAVTGALDDAAAAAALLHTEHARLAGDWHPGPNHQPGRLTTGGPSAPRTHQDPWRQEKGAGR